MVSQLLICIRPVIAIFVGCSWIIFWVLKTTQLSFLFLFFPQLVEKLVQCIQRSTLCVPCQTSIHSLPLILAYQYFFLYSHDLLQSIVVCLIEPLLNPFCCSPCLCLASSNSICTEFLSRCICSICSACSSVLLRRYSTCASLSSSYKRHATVLSCTSLIPVTTALAVVPAPELALVEFVAEGLPCPNPPPLGRVLSQPQSG